MLRLPEEYISRMKRLVSDWESFESCYNIEPTSAVRVNTLKLPLEKAHILGFNAAPVPFCDEGFILNNQSQKIGSSPWHHCGAIYSQEPAAMSAVEALEPQKGERILDMCAAPGGKSTQIAAKQQGEGLLLCNEYTRSRTRALISNLERSGVKNAAVCSASAEFIANALPEYFDKVLVDAPCSGEGMFRKSADALSQWSPELVRSCAEKQKEILYSASKCLVPGGTLVYSTCTFSTEENEELIADFLSQNREFSLIPVEKDFGESGISLKSCLETSLCRRVYPTGIGEGQFVARLKKKGDAASKIPLIYNQASGRQSRFTPSKEALTALENFWVESMNIPLPREISQINDCLYLLPSALPEGLPYLRAGVLLGELKTGGKSPLRFEPAHALYMASQAKEHRLCLDYSPEGAELAAFLRGEELDCSEFLSGYAAVCCCGIVTGFGKCVNGRLKNHYPKGLRNNK